MGAGQVAHVAAEFDHRALHAQANAEERNALRAGVANRRHLAFDAALAEAAGHQDAVVAGQQPLGPFRFDILALNAADADLRPVGDAGMIERFVNRLVRVVMLGVFADDGDADFVLRIAQPAQQLAPIFQIGLGRLEARACRQISSSSLLSTRLSGTS